MTQPLVSIVILVHDGLALLRACLDSIRAHTPEPHEIIIVDNGSTESGLRAYLDREKAHGIRVLRFGQNLGFAAGNNRALKVARGRFLLLLNSDTVVTDGWLTRMLAVMEADPATGMVGPLSNFAGGRQGFLGQGHYTTPEGLTLWARHVARSAEARREYGFFLSGFCLLVRRECLEQIGPLDERFGLGGFEDNDWALRASVAGWRLAIAADAWVHHEGSRTFAALGISPNDTMHENHRIFLDKWGQSVLDWPARFASLTMVHDDDTWLPVALASIYDSVDALYIVADSHPWAGEAGDISHALATLAAFPDPDRKLHVIQDPDVDRSLTPGAVETACRNVGLEAIWRDGYDYAVIVDADEVYDPAELAKMKDYARSNPHVEAWQVGLWTYWKDPLHRIDPPEQLRPALFIKKGRHFTHIRANDSAITANLPDELGRCHHLSYCRTDEACRRKIEHFAHKDEILAGWWESKWLAWDSDHALEDLHPTHPPAYKRTIEVDPATLPPALRKSLEVTA